MSDPVRPLDLGDNAIGIPGSLPDGLDHLRSVLEGYARAGKTVTLAGPATDDLDAFEALAGAFAANGGALLGLDLIEHTPAGRTTIAAAAQRAAGEPVYLRYAAEEGGPVTLQWHLAAAIAFAGQVLGEPHAVYVQAVRDGTGTPVHLAAMTRHANDCVALLGAGVAGAADDGSVWRGRLAQSLFLGNRGAVESNLVAGGVVLTDDKAPTGFSRLRDERAAAVASWTAAARALVAGKGRRAAETAARQMVVAASAITRSLASGRSESLSLDADRRRGPKTPATSAKPDEAGSRWIDRRQGALASFADVAGSFTARRSAANVGDRPANVYRVALLSNAMHQDRFAQAFAAHPRLRVVAVVDEPDQEPYVVKRNRALAEQLGVPYVESFDALSSVNGEDVDVVSVCSQIERRGRATLEAARRGKHLWLDKPPVASVVEVDALAAAAAASGAKSLVFSHVAAAWGVALRTAIERGDIGTLRALHMDFHFIKGDAFGLERRRVPAGAGPRDVWTFRDPECATDPTESGHNVVAKRELSEEGWYALALAWRICPQPVQRVYASGGSYFLRYHGEHNVEDFSTLVMSRDDGPVVTISTGRTGTRTHPGGGRMLVRAVGDRGTILVDGGQPPVFTYVGAAPAGRRNVPTADSTGLNELVDCFVSYLDGDAPPPMTAAAACDVMRVIDAAYQSFATGEPVAVARTPEPARRL